LRVNVWIPDELAGSVKERLPELNVSAVLQEALRDRLGCRHDRTVCASCAASVDSWQLGTDRLERFYLDLLDGRRELILNGGTAEGAARIAKDVGTRHQIGVAARQPLPRPTRAERLAAKVRPFPGTEAIA
jgi:hypothetical protein